MRMILDAALVPEAGLEPARHLWHRILSPARLPVPPLRQELEAMRSDGERDYP